MNTNTRHCTLDEAKRLLEYATLLRKHLKNGRDVISANHLATEAEVSNETLRGDFELAGVVECNIPAYSVELLINVIDSFLGCSESTDAVLVGTDETVENTRDPHFNIAAAFNVNDPAQAATADGISVFHVSKLPDLVGRMQLHIGILAVPSESAQHIANMMVTAGITDIWNCSGGDIQLPDSVTLHVVS